MLSSYTHTGFDQIEARMSVAGLQSNYTLEYVRRALRCADLLQLASSIVVAEAAGNLPLAQSICDRLGAYAAENGPRP